ncbi:MAG: hypothetical protein ACFFCS_11420 [Candidatus Hodarchaeota archaeon]
MSQVAPGASINSNPHVFKINEYLTLKLERGQTNIYVNGQIFNQCKYLLLNVDLENSSEYDDIESIDEAAVRLDNAMEYNHSIINPATEFWGHCSNIQAWADCNYDTRLLHSNLSFPLLKALVDAGDPVAQSVFKNEIMERLKSRYLPTIIYLAERGFLNYLGDEAKNSKSFVLNFMINRILEVLHDKILQDDELFEKLLDKAPKHVTEYTLQDAIDDDISINDQFEQKYKQFVETFIQDIGEMSAEVLNRLPGATKSGFNTYQIIYLAVSVIYGANLVLKKRKHYNQLLTHSLLRRLFYIPSGTVGRFFNSYIKPFQPELQRGWVPSSSPRKKKHTDSHSKAVRKLDDFSSVKLRNQRTRHIMMVFPRTKEEKKYKGIQLDDYL